MTLRQYLIDHGSSSSVSLNLAGTDAGSTPVLAVRIPDMGVTVMSGLSSPIDPSTLASSPAASSSVCLAHVMIRFMPLAAPACSAGRPPLSW